MEDCDLDQICKKSYGSIYQEGQTAYSFSLKYSSSTCFSNCINSRSTLSFGRVQDPLSRSIGKPSCDLCFFVFLIFIILTLVDYKPSFIMAAGSATGAWLGTKSAVSWRPEYDRYILLLTIFASSVKLIFF